MSKKSGEFAPKIHRLAYIGAVGQAEHEAMLERQREGIAKATREGRYQGRVPTSRRQAAEIIRLSADGVTAREIAFRLVGRARVYRVLSGGRPSGCVKSISTDAQTTHLPSAPYPADRMDRSFAAGSSPVAA